MEKREGRAAGYRVWAIAEGWMPPTKPGADRALASHETVCILNAGALPAKVSITIFFADREPAGPYTFEVAPRRTKHVRFNDLKDPEPIPEATDYSSLIESNVPIVVQHTRLDSRQPNLALLSTTAFPVG